ncbi:MAG: PEGA domain-containing protein [Tunicatimonas sp.]
MNSRNHSKTIKVTAQLLAWTILISSCSSATMIQSNPSGAKLYVDEQPVGVTPYRHRDTKIVGSTTYVRLEKEGYETLNTAFSRDEEADVGAIIGGIFLLFPFLWTMKYKPSHTYEMNSLSGAPAPADRSVQPQSIQPQNSGTKAAKLRELKGLLDEELITQEEYDTERAKIMNSDQR